MGRLGPGSVVFRAWLGDCAGAVEVELALFVLCIGSRGVG